MEREEPREYTLGEYFKEQDEKPKGEGGNYLKMEQAPAGTMVKIETVKVLPFIENGKIKSYSPVISGPFFAKGQKEPGQTVQVRLNKTSSEACRQMWGDKPEEWIGKMLLSQGTRDYNIQGVAKKGLSWAPLP